MAMAETQQAIAVSSPYFGRISSSDSNWRALVSMATWEANFLNGSGSFGDQKTVRFGSGAAPRLYRVFRARKVVRVTSGRPSAPIPPIDQVTQVGSPE